MDADIERTTRPKRRRWYQFSLRTLLIVVTLSAIPLGWVGWKLEQARRERAAIAWVEEMGGRVQFGGGWVDSWFGLGVSHVYLSNTQVSDEQVQKLRKALPNCRISHSIRVEK